MDDQKHASVKNSKIRDRNCAVKNGGPKLLLGRAKFHFSQKIKNNIDHSYIKNK